MNQYPIVMGILNLSAHSFYQAIPNYSDALKKAEEMIADGAKIIDVGGVATNPTINLDSDIPSVQQELDSVIPFIELLSKKMKCKISVDTYRAIVMEESIHAGAHMINDQRALTEENALKTAVKLNVPVCLMHHFNPPRLMETQRGWTEPRVENCEAIRNKRSHASLLLQIKNELNEYTTRCLQAGLLRDNIILDPGFGGGNFGKTADENFYLLAHLKEFVELGFPMLVGLSRKIMFKEIAPAVEDRLPASLAAAVIAAQNGASIIRVHDVKATVDAMWVLSQIGRT